MPKQVVEAVALVVAHSNGAQREGLAALMQPLVAALQQQLAAAPQQSHAAPNGHAEDKENAAPPAADIAAALPIVDRMTILFRCAAAAAAAHPPGTALSIIRLT